ncbi:recombinase family protein [Bremerella sp. T1]|uniref:recombinase family protein n=1 Tax=unclassified Bremerella TaxID=2795601 RepID=UPI001CCF8948|nr:MULTISPECIES: recombinase family protein [Bremerella]UBM36336.1 recombinase family protein [Bremerella volcania]WDI41018.1 recombinase family protein [Bremerella sp. P1]
MISFSGGIPSPKNGLTYLVLIVARISTVHQDTRSLEDQIAICSKWCEDNLDQKFVVKVIQSRGSGELLDRTELNEIEEAIESGRFDLFMAEDLARICRRNRAIDFLELAEDHDTRVVMLNDNLDTVNEDWRLKASFATMHHEQSNSDTSKRITRSIRNRFLQGMIQTVPKGYIKPFPKALDADVTKDPDAEPIVMEIISRLEKGESYSMVADFLNENQVPKGPFGRSKKWTAAAVSGLIHNPILKGIREAGRKMAKRNNKSGKRRSVKAPPENLQVRKVPHLAYIDAERYDRLLRKLDAKNAPFRRKKVNGRDSRANVPKKRTRFPGQQVFCAVCGHPMQWGGHGQVDHMVCKGARDYHCWQSATFDGLLASAKILTAVYEVCDKLPNFPETLQNQVRDEFQALTNTRESERNQIEKRIDKLTRDLNRLVEFILNGKGSDFVSQKIAETEAELEQAKLELQELESRPSVAPVLPTSDQVRELAKEAIAKGSVCPYELSRVMRKLIPRIEAHPMRLCDGGAIVIRAKFQLNLCSLVPGLNDLTLAREVMTPSLEVDLFEPVQREAFRERVIALRDGGMKQRDIAAELGITLPAVQNAAKLQAEMDSMGLQDPYIPVTEAPMNLNRMRRHLHPRFEFQTYEPGNQD